jgi:hypothetical protein
MKTRRLSSTRRLHTNRDAPSRTADPLQLQLPALERALCSEHDFICH